MTDSYNELKWIITEYGKKRLTEMLTNPEDKIKITKLIYGSNGSGSPKDRETEDGTGRLLEPRGITVIYEKGLATDRSNTVYFKGIIDENEDGFDIRELALIETVNGVDKMFAVGIGAPIVKPALDLGYIISIDYTLYIESINLYKVYDRVILDPENEFLREADIEDLHKVVLFAEGNLAEQIGSNSHILGLNRAEQLNELITKSQKIYANTSMANYYTSLSNSLSTSGSQLVGFWSFNYTNSLTPFNNIKDFSELERNISTRDVLNLYPQEYIGVLSTLNFKNGDNDKKEPDQYFYLNEVSTVSTNTSTIELGNLIDHNNVVKYTWYDGQWLLPSGTGYTEDYVKSNVCKYYLKATKATLKTEGTLTLVGNILSKGFVHVWTYRNSFWTNEIGTSYDIETFKQLIHNYTGLPSAGDKITLTTTKTPVNGDIISLTGKQFDLLNKQQNNDCPFAFMACLQHNKIGERNTILAQSSYFNNKHNFEITKTERNSISVTLFSNDINKYFNVETNENTVTSDIYSLVITYNGSRISPVIAIYINGERQELYTKNFNYKGMINNPMKTTSYIEDSNSNNTYNINAKVGLITLIKNYNGATVMDDEQSKCNSLILNSMCGKNVYYKV